MGEVYRAFDPRLSREVAVKVLRPGTDLDEGRVRRFAKEARTMGVLNHPNIVVVFDAGLHDGIPFVVSELLEGHPLRWHITRGTVGPQRAVEWGVQIAEGLAAAHDKGIVHRDLKPENVFVTEAGRIKILDFGVAKLLDDDVLGSTTGGSTDVSSPIGTPGYMSPEQLQGGEVDHRADIFALGAVLYEMLSGRKAFPGSLAQALAGVLSQDPPRLTDVPAPIERIVRRCLAKERRQRFQSAADLALALRAASAAPETIGSSPGWRRTIAAAVLVMAALGLVAGGRALVERRGAPAPHLGPAGPGPRLVPLTAFAGREIMPTLSADGDFAAFVWDGPERDNLDVYVRPLAGSATLRVTDDPAPDYAPTFLADTRSIAFVRGRGIRGEIRRVPVTGGPERAMRDVRLWYGTGLSASPDGRWLAYSDARGERFAVWMLSLADGTAQPVTSPGESAFGDAFPTFSPDGRAIAFVRVSARGGLLLGAEVVVRDLESGRERIVDRDAWLVGGLDWSTDGASLVFSSPRLGAPRLFRVSSEGGVATPLPLNDDPTVSNVTGAESLTNVSLPFRVSLSRRNDRLVYSTSRYDTNIWSARVDGGALLGTPSPLIASTRLDEAPQFSPDGTHIAFSSTRGSLRSEIWVCSSDGQQCSQLTHLGVPCGTPRWSPDGRQIVFDAPAGEQSTLFVVDVASRLTRKVDLGPGHWGVPSFSRDGRSFFFAGDGTSPWQVWTAPIEGGPAEPVTRGGGFAAFEDATGLVYTRSAEPGLFRRTGGREEQVLPMPECWGYWALAPGGVYALDSAAVQGPSITWYPRDGAPQPVLALRSAPACGEPGLAVSPDGGHLVWVEADRESDVVVVHNFR